MNIMMVSSKNEMIKSQKIVQIPGVNGNSLICTESEKIRSPNFSGDPAELLSKLGGRCYKIDADGELFEFCYEGESKLNGVSLGYFAGYIFNNNKLFSETSNGYQCGNSTYRLTTYYDCDYSAKKYEPKIPAFWHDKDDECHLFTEIYNRQLCKHHVFSSSETLDVTCISKNVYENIFV
ncbi:hypothetical protein TVAGG3_0255830 [Trichomonas vaginalis G3]|nr:hypothetical protein TVAGG3_0255830 [Trichomonas vaginalis G3]KAI5524730.1 hypothetical protein TVAGG3_0255830 [Trichomonas vaginalis G3]